MSQLRRDFLNWRPDADAFGNDGLTVADNVLHDSEGYKPLCRQTDMAFVTMNYYAQLPLASVRSMQVRAIGDRKNQVAAIVQDKATTAAIAELSVGARYDSGPFTTLSTATLLSASNVRVKSFSLAELGAGAFVACATFSADLANGTSTIYSITGDVAYTVLSVSSGDLIATLPAGSLTYTTLDATITVA